MSKKNQEMSMEEEAIMLDIRLNQAEAFIEKNLKKILLVLAGIVICAACAFLAKNYFDAREREAEKVIAKAQEAFAAQQYDQALNGDAQGAGLLKVISDYSSTKTANVAKLYAAICYANTGKTDEAIKMFEDFSQKGDQMISPASLAALGNCYIDKGENEKGIKLLVQAADEANNDAISPLFLVQAAEVYESMNQNDKALELYEKVKKTYLRSTYQQDIDKYIERVK